MSKLRNDNSTILRKVRFKNENSVTGYNSIKSILPVNISFCFSNKILLDYSSNSHTFQFLHLRAYI